MYVYFSGCTVGAALNSLTLTSETLARIKHVFQDPHWRAAAKIPLLVNLKVTPLKSKPHMWVVNLAGFFFFVFTFRLTVYVLKQLFPSFTITYWGF